MAHYQQTSTLPSLVIQIALTTRPNVFTQRLLHSQPPNWVCASVYKVRHLPRFAELASTQKEISTAFQKMYTLDKFTEGLSAGNSERIVMIQHS